MKKQFLLLALLVWVISSCTSTSNLTTVNPQPFEKVYTGLGHEKDELFILANEWFNESFGDAEEVITYRDKEAGVIIGKYLFYGSIYTSEYGTSDDRVKASLIIKLKDNKAKVSITPLGKIRYNKNNFNGYTYTIQDADKDMDQLANSFINYVHSARTNF